MVTARHGRSRWLLYLLALALVAVLLLPLVPPAPAPVPAPVATAPTAPADPLVVGGVDVGAGVSGALDEITASFSGIADPSSAQEALPHLLEARNALAGLEGPVASLSEQGHASLREMVQAAMPAIRSSAERLKTDGPVAAIVSPAVNDILAQLSAYSA
jgi:hypothetical protein